MKTYEEALQRLQVEHTKAAALRERLTAAKRSAYTGRGFMPEAEYTALEHDVRLQGQLCQRLQTEVARLKRERRNRDDDAFLERFKRAAFRLLDPVTFQALIDEARNAGEAI
ncbi:MAG TPA: hypothetical protein VEM95_04185 [Thermoplasmata archaeon]|nr:hypothetical protein [Thermoplasmata archaeon]